MRRYRSERLFQAAVILILTLCAAAALAPFLLVALSAFTEEASLTMRGYRFFPHKWSTEGIEYLLCFNGNGGKLLHFYGVSCLVVLLGTALHLLIAPMLAWPLARRDYSRRRVLTALVVFPLALSGGFVPWYIVWGHGLHIKNTIWAYVLPNLVLTPWQVLLYRQYFRANISQSLVDAAKLDGAGEWVVYWKLALPLAAPVLATIGLLVAFSYYSDWANGLFFISEARLHSFQMAMFNSFRLVLMSYLHTEVAEKGKAVWIIPDYSWRMALCLLGALPYFLLLPLLARAYTRAIRLGTVKT